MLFEVTVGSPTPYDASNGASILGGLSRLAHHSGKRRAAEVKVVLAGAAHRPEDVPAPVGLVADQLGIGLQIRGAGKLACKLGTCELDRRKRGAKLMRGRRDDAAKIGQLLLARERHLRGEERIAHHADLAGDAPRVEAEEHDADADGDPEAEFEDCRHGHQCTRGRSKRYMNEEQGRGEYNGQQANGKRPAPRQDRGRDRSRHEEQEREGVVEPASEGEQ